MSRQKSELVPEFNNPSQAEGEIIRFLERNTAAGRRCHEVFRDFVTLSLDSLSMMGEHLKSARDTGQLAADPPEMQDRWKTIWSHYQAPQYRENFKLALSALMRSVRIGNEVNWWDTVGHVYMQFAYPNPGTGQYFTPFHLAHAMASMTWRDGDLVYDRINEAMVKSGLDLMFGAVSPSTPMLARYLFEKFPHVIAPHYQAVTVCDPCCGSGVMFLASAASLPPWMTQWGLVKFHGQDIDNLCVQMAKLNLLLYGLNGNGLKWALELSGVELDRVPEPARTDYAEAQAEVAAGAPVEAVVEKVKAKVKKRKATEQLDFNL